MKQYILSIVVAGIICAIVDLLLDKKTSVGKLAKILTGILMSVTILNPITQISFKNVGNYLNSISIDASSYVEQGKSSAQGEISSIIKAQTEAYILDKAKSMDLDVAVEVELDENNSVPCGVTIIGDISPYAKGLMASYIEETVGITRENQKWT